MPAKTDLDQNPNTSWLNDRGSYAIYVLLILAVRFVVSLVPGVDGPMSWSVTGILHNAITFYLFHWQLGSPFEDRHNKKTWWEQLDQGEQYTTNRKFLTIVPVAYFLLMMHFTNSNPPYFYLNFASLVVIIIGKLPFMHRTRLFGINKEP